MRNFVQPALVEMQKIEKGENTFFRSYGATNMQEFFSVSVECFFELPLQFREYNPQMYVLLTRILKIDLLNFGRFELFQGFSPDSYRDQGFRRQIYMQSSHFNHFIINRYFTLNPNP